MLSISNHSVQVCADIEVEREGALEGAVVGAKVGAGVGAVMGEMNGKELPSKSSLRQHRSRLHKDTVFQCPLCLAEFHQKRNGKDHIKKCKEEPKSGWSELTKIHRTNQLFTCREVTWD